MSKESGLPAIVYGLGPSGFTVLAASPFVQGETRRKFIEFAKSISWRPIKRDVPDDVVFSIVPCPEGVLVCRISSSDLDEYGRELAIRVEGVLCVEDCSNWQSLVDPNVWPKSPIGASLQVDEYLPGSTKTIESKIILEQNLQQPLILASRKLINAPPEWFSS